MTSQQLRFQRLGLQAGRYAKMTATLRPEDSSEINFRDGSCSSRRSDSALTDRGSGRSAGCWVRGLSGTLGVTTGYFLVDDAIQNTAMTKMKK